MAINTLDRDTLLRQMAQMKERIKRLEQTLQGQEVSGVKIKNISWDKGSGGTLRLGGENDTDGSLEVYDSFSQLKARFNKNGLAFSDNINHTSDAPSDALFTSSSEVDITDGVFNIELTSDTIILALFTGTGYIYRDSGASGFHGNGIVRMNIDGVQSSRAVIGGGISDAGEASGATAFAGMSCHQLVTLGAGSHEIKVTGACDSSGTSPAGFRLYVYDFSIIDLGTTL